MKNDRTLIAPILETHFPAMKGASSQDWASFLNALTGLDVADDVPNGSAFDRWREALAEKHGLPVWGVTEAKKQAIKSRVDELLALENKRREEEGELLIDLRKAAP